MKLKMSLSLLIVTLFLNGKLFAHCEVPCGIYNDQLRVELLYEHFTTIEKAMNQIVKLSKEEDKNYNQIVRWITTKEDHAKKVQHIVNQYFMTQRIKPKTKSDGKDYDKYIKQITLSHELLVYAMKAKQTLELKHVEKLRETLKAFSESYFDEEDLKHLKHHQEENH